MALVVFNTLSRTKEPFVPLHGKKVGMYTCGPTVYHDAHIGNLRSMIFADVLKRTLKYLDFGVKHVMNITDVGHLTSDADEGEDKMLAGARREKLTTWDIAKKYEKLYFEDAQALNILTPDIICKATEHIGIMQGMIQRLEKNEHTYVAEGNVYYDISTFPKYEELAHIKLEEEKKSRVDEDKNKKNSHDFVLWFTKSKFMNQDMQWDSPWGRGFPGWHIECSAMSSHYLGDQFDIHTGGADLIPIHHTNEIAQAEGAFNKHPWVKYWMHGEFLVNKSGKMSKSKGEFTTLKGLKDSGYEPLAYRYLCLTAHYRQQLMFSEEAMDTAKASFDRLRNVIVELRALRTSEGEVSKFRQSFVEAIEDDLNTPKALGVLWEVLRSDELGARQKLELAVDFDKVFGLGIPEMKQVKIDLPMSIKKLVIDREEARKRLDWKEADRLRAELKTKGYSIKDTPEGPRVEKA